MKKRKHHFFFNRVLNKQIGIRLIDNNSLMPPSIATRLLLKYLRIKKGESVLDLGAGPGTIALVAKKLGAGAVTATEVDPSAKDMIRKNIELNGLKGDVHVCVGSMFEAVKGKVFDHIVTNLPSLPVAEGENVLLANDGGEDGRRYHDIFQAEFTKHLNKRGRVTMIHSSLCDLNKSIVNFKKLGYEVEEKGSAEVFFCDMHDLYHLEQLKKEGTVKFKKCNGKLYFQVYVLNLSMKTALQ